MILQKPYQRPAPAIHLEFAVPQTILHSLPRPIFINAFTTSDESTLKEAMNDLLEEHELWLHEIDEEINSIDGKEAWVLDGHPKKLKRYPLMWF